MPGLSFILDQIIPDTCVLCFQTQKKYSRHRLCSFCWADLHRIGLACTACSLPLPMPGLCSSFTKHPLVNGQAVMPLKHINDTRTLIHQLKFKRDLRAGQTLSALMLDIIRIRYQGNSLPECLIPVPLSWRNQFRRGYNQADWLAQPLGHALKIPRLTTHICRRHGPAQHSLSYHDRQIQQLHTFVLKKTIKFNHVAIVDDVLTTGGTVKALSQILHRSGVKQIDIWCASRALPPSIIAHRSIAQPC